MDHPARPASCQRIKLMARSELEGYIYTLKGEVSFDSKDKRKKRKKKKSEKNLLSFFQAIVTVV